MLQIKMTCSDDHIAAAQPTGNGEIPKAAPSADYVSYKASTAALAKAVAITSTSDLSIGTLTPLS